MRKIFEVIKATVLWNYDRGTWQYDVLCVAILAFIFLIPTSFFDERKSRSLKKPDYISTGELQNQAPATTLKGLLESAGSRRRGGQEVNLKHFEAVSNEDGVIVGYQVWYQSN